MEINIIELKHLPIFTGKNSKALKRSRNKGFRVFLLDRIVLVFLNYEENKTKRVKNPIFSSLKPLQHKAFNEYCRGCVS